VGLKCYVFIFILVRDCQSDSRLVFLISIWQHDLGFLEFINPGKIHVVIVCISTYTFIMFLLLSIRFFSLVTFRPMEFRCQFSVTRPHISKVPAYLEGTRMKSSLFRKTLKKIIIFIYRFQILISTQHDFH